MSESSISLPFIFDSAGMVNHTSDLQKIWQDRIAMVVMTKLNERLMRPSFGSEVPAVAFENMDTAQTLARQAISTAFSRWLPALTLIDVVFTTDPVDFYLVADIRYRYGPTSQSDNVKLKTAILTRSGDTILEVGRG
jgi:phage baseplate assembly protein W